ncbi:MAG: CD225/dispanin family protein [bacterium]
MTVPPEYTPQGPGKAAMDAGWYDDPFTDHLQRYWTGTSWTKETRVKADPVAHEGAAPSALPPPVAPANVMGEGPPVRDYLLPSILAVIFCAWPLAVFAVYFSIKSNSARKSGDMEQALRASERARLFIVLSIIAAILIAAYLIWSILTLDTSQLNDTLIPQQ